MILGHNYHICHVPNIKVATSFTWQVALRLDYRDGSKIRLGCACSLISQALLNIERHVIHQIKAELHSYQLVLMKV